MRVIARERSDEAIQAELCQPRLDLRRSATVTAADTVARWRRARAAVECDPSFRMAERVSPLRPLSMMAFQATAEGGDRFRGRH